MRLHLLVMVFAVGAGCVMQEFDGGEPRKASPHCCPSEAQPGVFGNPTCIEGATCCASGEWACNEGDGSPSCDDDRVCLAVDCCDPAEQPGTNGNPTCFEGASCCADGTWACNEGDGSATCDQGEICRP